MEIKNTLQQRLSPSTLNIFRLIRYEFHFLILKFKNTIFFQEKKFQNHLSKNNNLHYGCGSRKLKNFINIDGYKTTATDFCFDLRIPIPAMEESIRFIFTEHVLEHLDRKTLESILFNFYKILEKGGIVRIIVPDLEKFVYAYQHSDIEWFKKSHQSSVSYTPEKEIISSCEGLNSIFYNHMHKFIYDFNTLEIMLKKAGFKKIYKSTHLGSSYKELNLDSDYESRSQCSLYIEAIKT